MSTSTGASASINLQYPCNGEQDGESCVWEGMHHVDDEGRHWCPTGFMLCHPHGGVGTIDGPGQCQLWGERP